jgi:ketosteroid isomerase-like protein
MRRLSNLLTLLFALAPALAAQSAADSALVARIYADLTRGDVEAVVDVLDDHVLWTEGVHSLQAGRHFGPGTVAARVLRPQVTAGAAYVPDAITSDRGYMVAVGTAHRTDPATGHLVVARFRHVWHVVDRRVVGVDRADDGPDLSASDNCGSAPC